MTVATGVPAAGAGHADGDANPAFAAAHVRIGRRSADAHHRAGHGRQETAIEAFVTAYNNYVSTASSPTTFDATQARARKAARCSATR